MNLTKYTVRLAKLINKTFNATLPENYDLDKNIWAYILFNPETKTFSVEECTVNDFDLERYFDMIAESLEYKKTSIRYKEDINVNAVVYHNDNIEDQVNQGNIHFKKFRKVVPSHYTVLE